MTADYLKSQMVQRIQAEFELYAVTPQAGLFITKDQYGEYSHLATRAAWRAYLEAKRRPAPPGYRLVSLQATPDMGYAYLEAAHIIGDKRDWFFSHEGFVAAVKQSPQPDWAERGPT